ncbi:MAG: IS110 family transposase [Cyanobacteria bacterium RM1_2_2]|nr:IS110 family transposase [Cyanobacteria bacterium RM1_2_2]
MNISLRVAGIDVSRGSVTVAILDKLPDQRLKDFIKGCKIRKFKSAEIEQLLALEFDCAVLEPTGGHYSKFWAIKIEQSGRQVRWVGHREVHGYRESWRLPDKTDKTDAVALACYGLERWNMPGMFLELRDDLALELREKHLQIQFLNRSGVPFINRLRQQLHWECPELAEKTVDRRWLGGPAGMWRAIGGDSSPRWDAILNHSIGLGISPFSRELAAKITAIERSILRIESEIELLLQAPELKAYLTAMEPFHFGRRASVAILSAIYPLDKFRGKRNPLGAFKLSCGLAQVWVESGDFKGWSAGGDSNIRKALWLWAFVTIPQNKVTSPELEILRDYYQNGSTQVIVKDGVETVEHFDHGKGSQRLMRTARRALTMLYRKLRSDLS